MSEEKEGNSTSIPKEVVQQIYSDALHPTMQAVGNIIALPFQAVDAALQSQNSGWQSNNITMKGQKSF